MATTTGVFLPDEQEQQLPKKSPQSAKPDHAELAKLSEQELKTAIRAAWKKHEELAKADMAPLLFWLRERLRAQGSRNDIHDKDRGFGVWVEEHLDISRRTADRWCEWYAVQAGLKPLDTRPEVDSGDVGIWEDILEDHKDRQQIVINYWVKTAVHAQYQKALTKIQKKFGLKDKKEALVKGVIYAAQVISTGSSKRPAASTHQRRNRGRSGMVRGVRIKRGTRSQ